MGGGARAIKTPFPYSEDIPANMTQAQYDDYCLWHIDTHIPEYVVPADNIAAILVEPSLAEGGNWIPSAKFMSGLRRICDERDWLLIADEVLTGLGRTGRMWSVEHYDVVPDILVGGENAHVARSVRDEMLKRGVWAICDHEPQVRLHPALNMAPEVLLRGLDRMAEAIDQVERQGATVGNYPPLPSGNVGF